MMFKKNELQTFYRIQMQRPVLGDVLSPNPSLRNLYMFCRDLQINQTVLLMYYANRFLNLETHSVLNSLSLGLTLSLK